METLLSYLKDEKGQTSTEYILLLAVVALIVIKFKGAAVPELEKLTTGIFGAGQSVLTKVEEEITR